VKIPVDDFESKVLGCYLRPSGPWEATFSLSGVNMTVKWEMGDPTFTVSGEYGI